MLAAIWDAHVKDMGWAVCDSSSQRSTQEVPSDMKFTDTLGATSKQGEWSTHSVFHNPVDTIGAMLCLAAHPDIDFRIIEMQQPLPHIDDKMQNRVGGGC